MSGEPISRPEFDLYLKMNAESNQSTAKAIEAIQMQGQETLEVLKELIIHNSVKHDNTNERLIKLFEKLKTLEEAVEANSKITEFWQTVKKYAAYVLIGGLTVYGGYLVKHYIIDETPTPLVTQ